MTSTKEICDINAECERRFSCIEDGIGNILENQLDHNKKLDNLLDRMFKDNGVTSYQTFRRSTEAFMKVHLWVYGIIASGILLTSVGLLVNWVAKK